MNLRTNPRVEKTNNLTIITVAGRIRDVETTIVSELEAHADRSESCHLLLDFSNVENLSGLELGTLLTFHRRTRSIGDHLTLFNVNARIYEVFTITGLQAVLRICREE